MEQPVSSGHYLSCETETHATFRSHEYFLCQINANCCNLHLDASFVGARLKLPRCARCRITQSEGRLKMTGLLISVSHLY